MRINAFVASSSGMSRRAADLAISSGRVQVDGRIATLGEPVDMTATVTLDGKPIISRATSTLIMLNKPKGYISSRTKQGKSPILFELLPEHFQKLRTVGRLDRDSTGLILLTDDGAFIQRHTHPSFEKEKIYEVTLDQPLSAAGHANLEVGVKLSDGLSRIQVKSQKGTELTLILSEGRNRQIRRTFAALGYKVRRLHRIQMGMYQLENLTSGQWRALKMESEA
jgi:23S rRNA pseudouridine2605 synthase